MNWITNIVRPKVRALVKKNKKDIPDNLWTKCSGCGAMLFNRDLENNLNVCTHCGYHMRLSAKARLNLLFDEEVYQIIELPKVAQDPLKFKDQKKYADRLKDYQKQTNQDDAIIVAHGAIEGIDSVVAILDFSFMGGSMGVAVGEGLVTASKLAVAKQAPLVVVSASGGARMQESILSLMQMPRSIVAVNQIKDAGLPYVVILTDPTTGGVTASFAMLGDVHIAEPGATIGFAGARVIQETIKETLPKGFQKSEYLKDHGMVDVVVERKKMKATLANILGILLKRHKTSVVVPMRS